MPRVSREQSEANRAAITAASARLFRERGIDGVSVADLMAAAGLTHGGFYGHFASKDALAAEACGAAFAHSVERWRKRVGDEDGAAAARAALVEGYLSAKSRGSPGTSCPAATLAGDVAREPSRAPVRAAYLDGIEHLVAILASVQPSGPHARQRGAQPAQREGALADLASMVGALLLARATAEHAISDEFLAAARKRLLSVSVGVSARGSGHVSARGSGHDSAPASARTVRRGERRHKPRRPAA
jgi:TetR/AcrR family transcriptional repressor of nem operon